MAFDAFNVTIPASQIAADAVRWQVRHRTTYKENAIVVSITETMAGVNSIIKAWTDATGGTWTATFGATTTAPLAYNATASQVETAIETLFRDVAVSGAGTPQDPWIITIQAPGPNPFTVGVTFNGANLTGGTLSNAVVRRGAFPIQDVWTNARGGTFTLSHLGHNTAALAWNATAAQVDTALDGALAAVGEIVAVTGSGTQADPWRVSLQTGTRYSQPLMTADSANLTDPAPTQTGDWIEETFIGTEVTIAGLVPNTRYEYQTRKVTTAGGQTWSASKFVTTDSVTPGLNKRPTPTGVKVSAASLAGITKVVDEVDDRDYAWREHNAEGETVDWQSPFNTYHGPGGTPENPTLVAGRSYSGTLTAPGDNIGVDTSDAAQWEVTIPPLGTSLSVSGTILNAIQLGIPPSFASTLLTATSTRFTWTNVIGNNGYQIRLLRRGFTQPILLTVERDTITVDATDLVTGVIYDAYIKTLGEGRFTESAESTAVVVDLNLDQRPPPSNYRAVNPTTTTIPLSWNRDPHADSYSLRWKTVDADDFGTAVTVPQPSSGTTVTHTVPSLTSNTEYELELTTTASPPYASSDPVSIEVFTAGAVSDLPLASISVSAFTANSVALALTATAQANVSYVINRENTVTERVWIPATRREVTIGFEPIYENWQTSAFTTAPIGARPLTPRVVYPPGGRNAGWGLISTKYTQFGIARGARLSYRFIFLFRRIRSSRRIIEVQNVPGRWEVQESVATVRIGAYAQTATINDANAQPGVTYTYKAISTFGGDLTGATRTASVSVTTLASAGTNQPGGANQHPTPEVFVTVESGITRVVWEARTPTSQYEVDYKLSFQQTRTSTLLSAGVDEFRVPFNLVTPTAEERRVQNSGLPFSVLTYDIRVRELASGGQANSNYASIQVAIYAQ